MNQFKVGDFVIIKPTIGVDNEVCEVISTRIEVEPLCNAPYQVCRLSNGRDYIYYLLELWDAKKDLNGEYKMKKELRQNANAPFITVKIPKLEIKVGGVYKSGWGDFIRIVDKIVSVDSFDYISHMGTRFDKNGKHYRRIAGESINDLQYEVVKLNFDKEESEMQISMDKKYKTLDGRDAKIIAICDNLDQPVIGIVDGHNAITQWTIDGRKWKGGFDRYLDLVEVSPYADFKVDDKVLVNDGEDKCWYKRYFAGIDSDTGEALAFLDGKTSWGRSNSVSWANCISYLCATSDMEICDD
jgi:hypothetical protein